MGGCAYGGSICAVIRLRWFSITIGPSETCNSLLEQPDRLAVAWSAIWRCGGALEQSIATAHAAGGAPKWGSTSSKAPPSFDHKAH